MTLQNLELHFDYGSWPSSEEGPTGYCYRCRHCGELVSQPGNRTLFFNAAGMMEHLARCSSAPVEVKGPAMAEMRERKVIAPVHKVSRDQDVHEASRDQDVQDLANIIGKRNLQRCRGCDRYILNHEECPHCAGTAASLQVFQGRVGAMAVVAALYEAKKAGGSDV